MLGRDSGPRRAYVSIRQETRGTTAGLGRPPPTPGSCPALTDLTRPPPGPAEASLARLRMRRSSSRNPTQAFGAGPTFAQAHGGLPERCRLPAATVAMAAPAPGLISVFSSPQELGASLAQLVVQRAACCLEGTRARFALGLSGGSLVTLLARELPAAAAATGAAGLARWTLGFCDERLVPFEHAESTYGLYRVRATGATRGHAMQAAPAAECRLRGPPWDILNGPRPPSDAGYRAATPSSFL
ncbi:6-phosphogluconolactonase [Choloepus didactylus]|uniref:6-phosphogluconolactonase n=1 Tax=Choloepus didactylus TaxID=27675 RepID=UPI0018A01C08|nr:6-phosphogluconolactonase [Choloepus didactylus]XP_037674055.1 6-phosphogluconolactonase [Choloepus didactylus]